MSVEEGGGGNNDWMGLVDVMWSCKIDLQKKKNNNQALPTEDDWG